MHSTPYINVCTYITYVVLITMNYNTWHIPQSWQGESFSPASCGYCVRHGHVTRIVSASSLSPHGFRSRLLIHGADPVGRPPPTPFRSGSFRVISNLPPPRCRPMPAGRPLPASEIFWVGRKRESERYTERERGMGTTKGEPRNDEKCTPRRVRIERFTHRSAGAEPTSNARLW